MVVMRKKEEDILRPPRYATGSVLGCVVEVLTISQGVNENSCTEYMQHQPSPLMKPVLTVKLYVQIRHRSGYGTLLFSE